MPQIHTDSTHTTSITVSFPAADLERLDRRLDDLKTRGQTMKAATRAKLIRLALAQLFAKSNEEIETELDRWNPRANTCSKCGARGFTARTCGKTHNVDAAPIASSPATAAQVPEAPPLFALRDTARSKSPPRSSASQHVPPGWTPEEDRREELLALSDLTIARKTGRP